MIPTSLYIHIPWCIRKCPYCDFNSHKSPEQLPEQEYIQRLINDFAQDYAFSPKQWLSSIFIGGGTPSLLAAESYATLFSGLKKIIPFSPTIEITLEANPGSVEQQRFYDYHQLGINRLSLGIQSFNPRHLQKLQRVHDDKQARNAIDSARKAGFTNLNLDIMHGLPTQTCAEGIEDLNCALAYQPEHISWYQLTLEPNTLFYKYPPPLPPDEELERLEQDGLTLLAKHGYKRYEISAFAQKNCAAQHNMNYWLFGDYYGIGAGAHGKISSSNEGIYRTYKQRQPSVYLDQTKDFLVSRDIISKLDLIFEFMLNACRLFQPIPNHLFTERTHLPFSELEQKLDEAVAKKLIIRNSEHWQVTSLGRRFTNDLQALFLPE